MNGFDKLTPTVNPRRYLKLVDHAKKLISDDTLRKLMHPVGASPSWKDLYSDGTNDQLGEIATHIEKVTRKPGAAGAALCGVFISGTEILNLRNFISRFLLEIRNAKRAGLVQNLDNQEYATFGVFVRTATAKAWPEYANMDSRSKYIADAIIMNWKQIEDEMRQSCLEECQLSKNPRVSYAVQELASRAASTTALVNRPNLLQIQLANAIYALSEAYVSVLELTTALEAGTICFMLTAQNTLYRYGLTTDDICVIDVANLILDGCRLSRFGDMVETQSLSELRRDPRFIQYLTRYKYEIRGWFGQLHLSI